MNTPRLLPFHRNFLVSFRVAAVGRTSGGYRVPAVDSYTFLEPSGGEFGFRGRQACGGREISRLRSTGHPGLREDWGPVAAGRAGLFSLISSLSGLFWRCRLAGRCGPSLVVFLLIGGA